MGSILCRHKSRLPALPGKGVGWLRRAHVTFNKVFQNVIGHTVAFGIRVEVTFLQVKTIVAAQVAVGRSRFDEQRERLHGWDL
jgi:hypothetical protein